MDLQTQINPDKNDRTASAPYLTAQDLMVRFGYRDTASFFSFVRREGVPFIRLSLHKLVFDPASVDAWIAKRTVGKRAPRK